MSWSMDFRDRTTIKKLDIAKLKGSFNGTGKYDPNQPSHNGQNQ